MTMPIKIFNVILSIVLIALVSISGHSWASGDEQQSPYADWAIPSRDGSKLAFVVSKPAKRSAIWISERDGSSPQALMDWPDSTQTEPDWTTDDQTIVFASNRGSRRYNIWTIRLDGSLPTQLTTDVADNRQPRYSPDGSKILFTSNRTGKRELWLMASDGSNQQAIALQTRLVGDPSWSPDGRHVVYAGCTRPLDGHALTDGTCNLFAISLDTHAVTQLTTGNFEDWNPDWGTSEIIFSSNRDHTSGLWLVNPKNVDLKQITSNSLDIHPKWDRYSNSVVFTRGNEIWSTDLYGNETQLTHMANTNHPPVANAGMDQTVECTGQGGTNVTLNGSASSDPDNDSLIYTWTGQFGTASGPTPTVALSMGLNTITLTVTDGKGGTSSDEVIVNVVDTTAPSIENISANPSLLWPPNHKMTSVVVNVSASDSCSPTTVCKIVSVNSNEPINGLGDGDTAPDWEINGNLGVTLRAERAGTGNGRIYTITVQCTDASGNSATKETVVTVHRNGSTK